MAVLCPQHRFVRKSVISDLFIFLLTWRQAVASMGSDDAQPRSTMSRNNGDSRVITGARAIRHRPSAGWMSNNKVSTWPANPDKDLNPPPASLAHGWVRKKARTRRDHSPPCEPLTPQSPMQTSV